MKSYTEEYPFTQKQLTEFNMAQDVNQDYDLSEQHQKKIQTINDDIAQSEFMMLIDTPEQPQEFSIELQQPKEEPQAEPQEAPEKKDLGVAADIGMGVIEAPRQVVGGAIDAVNETFNMTQDIADWLNENVVDLGGIAWGEDGIRWASGEELAGVDQLEIPTTQEARSTTGNVIRNISSFITGFVGAGKGLKAVNPTTTGGKIGKAMGQGAVADFSVFNPVEERLSNLVQSAPALRNPVTEYLAADEDDSKIEGRIKNAVEGLGVGVAFEGFMKALRGIKNVRKGRVEQVNEFDRQHFTIDEDEIVRSIEGPELREFPEGKKVVTDESDVFVNWSRIDTPDDVKEVMEQMVDASKSDINAARRGKQTFEQIKLNAEAENAWEILKSRNVGQPLNAEQSFAARELWTRSGNRLTEIAEEAARNPSDQNLFALKKMMAVHNEIQQNVIAARTETARALASWRIPSTGTVFADDLLQSIERGGGRDNIKQIAERITLLSKNGNVKEMDEFVRRSAWAKTSDAVSQAWRAGLLSSPHTHMRNAISQTAILGQQMYERKAANLLGQIFGYDSAIPQGEVSSMATGLIEGFKESFRVNAKGRAALKTAAKERAAGNAEAAKQALIDNDGLGNVWKNALTGESGFYGSKIEGPQAGALSAEAWGASNNSIIGKGLNFIDTVSQVPYRALSVSDEGFKTSAYRMELNAKAHRIASEELASGKITKDEFKDRMARIISEPTEEMVADINQFAKEMTFQETPRETGMRKAWDAVAHIPVLGKLMLPFNKTPYNIAVYGFERTPFAPLVARWREDFAAGGMRREMAMAKMSTGTMILAAMADLAMDGHITGSGPVNPAQRNTERRMGVQPNSIKIDDRYFSYRGMDPISTPLGLASEVVDILVNTDIDDEDIEIEQMVIATSMAIANQVTSQQYMTGVSNFFSMMSEPERYGSQWWNQLAGTVIPGGVANVIRKQDDPYARAAYNMIDAIKARTPGLSSEMPARRDLWGDKIDYRSGLGDLYDAISPLYSSKADASEIDKELNNQEIWIGGIPKRVNFDGVSINMKKHPFAYERLQVLSGNEMVNNKYGVPIDPVNPKGLKDNLDDLVSGRHPLSFEYNMRSDGSDGGKAQMIRSYVNQYREAAREIVLDEYPELKAEYDDKQTRKKVRYSFLEGI